VEISRAVLVLPHVPPITLDHVLVDKRIAKSDHRAVIAALTVPMS